MLEFFCGIKDFVNKVKRFDFSDFLICGVSSAEYALMDFIADKMKVGERSSVWVSEITDEVPITAQAVSKSLKALEGKGYIERFVNEKDRRMMGVRFLEKGSSMYFAAQKEIMEFACGIESVFNEAERREFIRLTRKFEKAFMENLESKIKQKQMNGGQ